jgi:hypothetical protein
MDRRNQPTEFWGQSVTFWWRLWQSQIEYSIRFWGAMAEKMPHPSAAQLAADAEAMREICERRENRERAPKKPAASKAEASAAQRIH